MRLQLVDGGDAEQGHGAADLGFEDLGGPVDAGLAAGHQAVQIGAADQRVVGAGGHCRAVIAYNGARRTVSEGDRIGDDVVIEKITAMDVEASKDGKREKLHAALAPSRGGASSPKYANYSSQGLQNINLSGNTEQKAQQLETLFKKNPEEEISQEDKDAAQEEADNDQPMPGAVGAISDPGPPLGDTGLY